jgi:hypothetical protein
MAEVRSGPSAPDVQVATSSCEGFEPRRDLQRRTLRKMNSASATMAKMMRIVHSMVGLRPLLVVNEAFLVQR